MADTPSDSTPETATPPPRRRRARAEPTVAKPKRAAAAKPARRATTRRTPSVSESVAAPKRTVKKAAAAATTATTKAVRKAKPKVKAVANKVVEAEQSVTKSKVGRGFLIGGALAAIAATVAGIFGRKKIAEATTKSIDKVMGEPEREPGQPTMSAD
ncbi:cobalamin biosynthesis Mg chelatase CobN [Sphingomonas vulcanisoli]|uniref:Cobalamin biosynthesis Mg chelatase CobN n=1 Tax=Sphingomonas vulcanisoli TaxID=1658060 RepID=A0ABX0TYL1_9SPHN|nr:hypothetical protein [Sphingomonas vulcanisoli]NIJ08845.1 cobalamin biosynthesis Mg chelatase CobN [Sphingomonas vulcanisoli]